METLITASIGLCLYQGKYYIQIITPDYERHYYSLINKKVAFQLHQLDQLEIEEIDYDPTAK